VATTTAWISTSEGDRLIPLSTTQTHHRSNQMLTHQSGTRPVRQHALHRTASPYSQQRQRQRLEAVAAEIDRLITRFPTCPLPVSRRVDQLLIAAEATEARFWRAQ
jgi:hypothetical protein